MRIKSLLLSALAGLSVLAASCSKDSSTPTPTPAPTPKMTFKVGTTAYTFTPMTQTEAASNSAILDKVYFNSNANTDTLDLRAFNVIGTDTLTMNITVPLLPSKTGTYSLNTSLAGRNLLSMYYLSVRKAIAEINANQQAVRSWTTNGTMVLTKVDMVAKKVSGTFTFNQNFGNNLSINLSEGTFTDIPFFVQ